MKYLDLDETDPTALEALVAQAQADVNETLSRCGEARDTDGRLLDNLLNSLPPIARRSDDHSDSNTERRGRHGQGEQDEKLP